MCPAGHLNQGWSLLVRVFDVVVIIVIKNKNGAADWTVPFSAVIPDQIGDQSSKGPRAEGSTIQRQKG